MKRARAYVLTSLLAFAPALVAAGETFTVDATHSRVGFAVRHMVVATVRGEFGSYEVTADVDTEDLTNSSVKVKIDAASVDTRSERRDEHLRSEEFFDVESHPEITFESTSIERDGEQMVAVGNLTMRGVTKEVRMPFEIAGPVKDPWGNIRIGVSGRLSIDRTEYGLNYAAVIESGDLVVSKEVEIEIDIELRRKAD